MAAMRLFVFLVAFAATLACQQNITSGLTPEERILVLRYLDCIECTEYLDSVRALAIRKPEATVDSLNNGLLYGPGAQAVAAAESVLVLGYIRDSTWRVANNRPPLPLRMNYVTEARDRYVNGYRSRGAIGMGWIHNTRAVHLLDSAAVLPLPPDLKWAVIYARDSLPPQ
jgi:hypothetical protein